MTLCCYFIKKYKLTLETYFNYFTKIFFFFNHITRQDVSFFNFHSVHVEENDTHASIQGPDEMVPLVWK